MPAKKSPSPTGVKAAKAPKKASLRERKGAQTATKPQKQPSKKSTTKSSTRASAGSKTGGKKASGTRKGAAARTSAAKGEPNTRRDAGMKADPLPPTPEGSKAKHDHQDPRTDNQSAIGNTLGHRNVAKENHGFWKQRSAGRFNAVSNWFRRGRGR
ncbi:MAG TPA: hypothetical protein VFH47_04330 [Candidatus Thermoplasmatota archaeon]|nr:hypothetical protein [Candidatus Thermoplasmatota archaeon]